MSHRFPALLSGLAVLLGMGRLAWSAGEINLTTGFVEILRFERSPRTVAIGNPSVIEATVGDGRTIVLTAKAAGITNLVILDETGREISSAVVRVTPGRAERVVVRSSQAAQQYFCTPGCEPMGSVGQQQSDAAAPAEPAKSGAASP